jgi:hypothetical protein
METDKKTTWIERFNDYIADKLSFILSIMATFYIILTLTIIPLFYGLPSTPKDWATYLCTVIFQGIALPVLGYTSRKAGDKTDRMMGEMYKMTTEIDRLVKLIESQEEKVIEEVDEILDIEKKNKK